MTTIRRLATFTPTANATNGLIIELSDGRTIAVTQSALALATEEQIQVALRTNAGIATLYAHKNRDGSIALATGEAPDPWPEDVT